MHENDSFKLSDVSSVKYVMHEECLMGEAGQCPKASTPALSFNATSVLQGLTFLTSKCVRELLRPSNKIMYMKPSVMVTCFMCVI